MLDCIEARAIGKHPSREYSPDLGVQGDFVNLYESRGFWRFSGRARITGTRCDLQSAELHRFVHINIKAVNTAGDLVDAGKNCDPV